MPSKYDQFLARKNIHKIFGESKITGRELDLGNCSYLYTIVADSVNKSMMEMLSSRAHSLRVHMAILARFPLEP